MKIKNNYLCSQEKGVLWSFHFNKLEEKPAMWQVEMPNLEIKQVEVFFSQEHQAVVAYKNDKPQTALAAQHYGKGSSS